ncbi:MAG: hypothetical protein EGQ46_03025 [Clostridiales bacterium]|nr:hypothetical protein [Clostridiales bacterium]
MVCLVITDLKKRGVFDVLVGELCKKYATNDDASFVNGILAAVKK